MRLNGGVIGRANESSRSIAPGIWGWAEQSVRLLYEAFPRFSLGWDLTGLVNAQPYESGTFSVLTEEGISTGLAFKPDGTAMYIVGTGTDTVYQYTLGTAWDVTTASYASKSFSVLSQEGNASGLAFKPDGTKMYILGTSGDDVNEYDLSSAWDVTTASYASKSFSVASQENVPSDLAFKPDGTAMYIVGSTNDSVYQYSLSTAWDVSTATYASKSFSVTAQEASPTGLTFNSTGSRMYVVGSSNDTAYQYSLATPWDVSTASYDGVGLYINDTLPAALALRDDDSQLYAIGSGSDAVRQYNLPNPGNLQTPGYFDAQSFSVSAQESNPRGLAFKPDGTAMYIVGEGTDTVYQYTLSTAWDVSTASYASKSFSVNAQDFTPQELTFKPDGSRMYVAGATGDDINEYSLSTPWDVNTASYVQNFSVASQELVINGLYFRPDGLKLYVVGQDSDRVFQYTLGTAWDVSTASYDDINFSVVAQDNGSTGLYFKRDGTLMYTVGSVNDSVYQYSLSTPWDVSTAQYQDLAFNVQNQTAAPHSVVFRETDGTSMYVLDQASQKVHQYYLR